MPQAKIFDKCCALGPGIKLKEGEIPLNTSIELGIKRKNIFVVKDSTRLSEMKQTLDNIVEPLFRDNSFPYGCFLLTGTGIVPPDDFTLHSGDEIHISVSGVGTLINTII